MKIINMKKFKIHFHVNFAKIRIIFDKLMKERFLLKEKGRKCRVTYYINKEVANNDIQYIESKKMNSNDISRENLIELGNGSLNRNDDVSGTTNSWDDSQMDTNLIVDEEDVEDNNINNNNNNNNNNKEVIYNFPISNNKLSSSSSSCNSSPNQINYELDFHSISKENISYNCTICSNHCQSRSNYDYHCTGKGHLEAIETSTPQEIESLPPYLAKKFFYCEPCKFLSCTSYNFVRHCRSFTHIEMPGSSEVDSNQEGMFRCGLDCNFITSDRYEYERHVQSKLHLSNIPKGKSIQKQIFLEYFHIKNNNYINNNETTRPKELTKSSSSSSSQIDILVENDELYCDVCRYQLSTSNGYDSHCMSKGHKEAVFIATPQEIESLPPYRMCKTFYCEACNYVSLIKSDFIKHCRSFRHIEMPGSSEVDSNQKGMFRCGLDCNFITSDRYEYERHVQSKLHLSNIPKGKSIQKQLFEFDLECAEKELVIDNNGVNTNDISSTVSTITTVNYLRDVVSNSTSTSSSILMPSTGNTQYTINHELGSQYTINHEFGSQYTINHEFGSLMSIRLSMSYLHGSNHLYKELQSIQSIKWTSAFSYKDFNRIDFGNADLVISIINSDIAINNYDVLDKFTDFISKENIICALFSQCDIWQSLLLLKSTLLTTKFLISIMKNSEINIDNVEYFLIAMKDKLLIPDEKKIIERKNIEINQIKSNEISSNNDLVNDEKPLDKLYIILLKSEKKYFTLSEVENIYQLENPLSKFEILLTELFLDNRFSYTENSIGKCICLNIFNNQKESSKSLHSLEKEPLEKNIEKNLTNTAKNETRIVKQVSLAKKIPKKHSVNDDIQEFEEVDPHLYKKRKVDDKVDYKLDNRLKEQYSQNEIYKDIEKNISITLLDIPCKVSNKVLNKLFSVFNSNFMWTQDKKDCNKGFVKFYELNSAWKCFNALNSKKMKLGDMLVFVGTVAKDLFNDHFPKRKMTSEDDNLIDKCLDILKYYNLSFVDLSFVSTNNDYRISPEIYGQISEKNISTSDIDKGEIYNRPNLEKNNIRESVKNMFSLLIDNLDSSITIENLQEIFSKYGQVEDVYIPRIYGSSQNKGFAYVRFINTDEGQSNI
jgi:hypothetical protein